MLTVGDYGRTMFHKFVLDPLNQNFFERFSIFLKICENFNSPMVITGAIQLQSIEMCPSRKRDFKRWKRQEGGLIQQLRIEILGVICKKVCQLNKSRKLQGNCCG